MSPILSCKCLPFKILNLHAIIPHECQLVRMSTWSHLSRNARWRQRWGEEGAGSASVVIKFPSLVVVAESYDKEHAMDVNRDVGVDDGHTISKMHTVFINGTGSFVRLLFIFHLFLCTCHSPLVFLLFAFFSPFSSRLYPSSL